jgi:hypothetical protein
VRVQESREPVATGRPGLDGELDGAAIGARAELDPAGLEMAGKGRQAEGVGPYGDHAYGSVPRSGHPHDVLVAQRERPVAVELLKRREPRRRDAVEIVGDPPHHLIRAKLAADDPRPVDPVYKRPCSVRDPQHVVEVNLSGQLVWAVVRP